MKCAFKPGTKLRQDFVAASRFGPPMDDETPELISLLATRVGMLIEDSSVIALTCGGKDAAGIASVLDELERSAVRMSALIGAAKG